MLGKLFVAAILRRTTSHAMLVRMSEQPGNTIEHVAKWMQVDSDGRVTWGDTADRMRKSLHEAGMSPGEMADYLQVGGNTVSTWINGRIVPSATTLRLWALRTRVP